MKKYSKAYIIRALSAGLLFASFCSYAQQAPKPETLIKWRQSAFQVIGWNANRIKASIDGQYNKEEVIKAANIIAAISNGGLSNLFTPGTEQGKGWHDTAAKPELFKDSKHTNELFASLNKEANEFTKVVAIGDVASVKEQYGKLTRTCKACHDELKSKD